MTTSDGVTAKPKVLYLVGSLRNERIPVLANRLRQEIPDVEIFDDWYAAGPEADDYWKDYEQKRGRSYEEALKGRAAKNVFAFDKHNLDRSTHVLLVLPAGKSGHMEVMYGKYGVGAKAAILLEPDTDPRWDVMYQFVDTVLTDDSKIKEFVLGSDETAVRVRSPILEGEDAPGGLLRISARGRRTSRGNAFSGWPIRLLP